MGMGMIPKRACDLMKCEVVRLLKLTGNSIQPLRIIVPRKDQVLKHVCFSDLPRLVFGSSFSLALYR
jgi:hypothetical protein